MTNLADNFITTASGFPIYVNAVAPLNPQIGMAWHSAASGLQIWNGAAWVAVGGGGGGGIVDTQQVVMAPNAAGIGAAWAALTSPPAVMGKVTFGLFNGDTYVLTDEATPGTAASWLKVGSTPTAATAAEIIARTSNTTVVTPGGLAGAVTSAPAGTAADAGKLLALDAAGKIGVNAMPSTVYVSKAGANAIATDMTMIWTAPAAANTAIIDGSNNANSTIKNVTLDVSVIDCGTYT